MLEYLFKCVHSPWNHSDYKLLGAFLRLSRPERHFGGVVVTARAAAESIYVTG